MAINEGLFTSNSSEWGTPQDFFDKLNEEFGFRVDVCATKENAKCPVYFGLDRGVDGLKENWMEHKGPFWMNPPYGREIGKWVRKAAKESALGATVVALLPARTDTRWWHSYIWDEETQQPRPGVTVRFVRGRLKFGDGKNSAPFPSAVVIFKL